MMEWRSPRRKRRKRLRTSELCCKYRSLFVCLSLLYASKYMGRLRCMIRLEIARIHKFSLNCHNSSTCRFVKVLRIDFEALDGIKMVRYRLMAVKFVPPSSAPLSFNLLHILSLFT